VGSTDFAIKDFFMITTNPLRVIPRASCLFGNASSLKVTYALDAYELIISIHLTASYCTIAAVVLPFYTKMKANSSFFLSLSLSLSPFSFRLPLHWGATYSKQWCSIDTIKSRRYLYTMCRKINVMHVIIANTGIRINNANVFLSLHYLFSTAVCASYYIKISKHVTRIVIMLFPLICSQPRYVTEYMSSLLFKGFRYPLILLRGVISLTGLSRRKGWRDRGAMWMYKKSHLCVRMVTRYKII